VGGWEGVCVCVWVGRRLQFSIECVFDGACVCVFCVVGGGWVSGLCFGILSTMCVL